MIDRYGIDRLDGCADYTAAVVAPTVAVASCKLSLHCIFTT
jgi:hypothetical protein